MSCAVRADLWFVVEETASRRESLAARTPSRLGAILLDVRDLGTRARKFAVKNNRRADRATCRFLLETRP